MAGVHREEARVRQPRTEHGRSLPVAFGPTARGRRAGRVKLTRSFPPVDVRRCSQPSSTINIPVNPGALCS
ncbi:hypothetical protein P376_4212 [Streptomyces sp. HCCB10043]|nr:hypothetical protein P376_4212 [Streptomyces sp. HCCB10043]EWS96072.1 hypothetical protein SSIG_06860 [Streptomyces filamentosus NRRL 11379]